MRSAMLVHDGHTGIRLDDHGHMRCGAHGAHDRFQLIRPGGAVHAHGRRAHLLQRLHRVGDGAAEQQAPVRFDGERAHHGQIADGVRRVQRRDRFVDPHHRFNHDQVGAGGRERADLFRIDVEQRLIGQLVRRPAGRRDVAGDVHGRFGGGGGLLRERDQTGVQLLEPVFQPVQRQTDPVGGKGGCKEDAAAGAHIGALQRKHRLRVLERPQLAGNADRHAGLSEVGAGCAVEQYDAAVGQRLKFFRGHGYRPS